MQINITVPGIKCVSICQLRNTGGKSELISPITDYNESLIFMEQIVPVP